jgi:hypothetical protein
MSVQRGYDDGLAGRRSLALIHRCRPSAPRTRPTHSSRSITHQSSRPAVHHVAVSTWIGGSTAWRSASLYWLGSKAIHVIRTGMRFWRREPRQKQRAPPLHIQVGPLLTDWPQPVRAGAPRRGMTTVGSPSLAACRRVETNRRSHGLRAGAMCGLRSHLPTATPRRIGADVAVAPAVHRIQRMATCVYFPLLCH